MNFRNLFWVFITILVFSFTANAELSCSFVVDLDPPVIDPASIYPAPGSNITESYICSSFDVYDSLAGVNTSLLFAALTIYNDRLESIDTLTLLTEDGFCRNYQNCDSVVVCVRARDMIPETDCGCLVNFLEYCWWFTVKFCDEGPVISESYPDPYGVIVSCADQYASFNVIDTNLNCDGTYYTILEDSFEVNIRVNNNGLMLDTTIVGTSWDGITWTPITSTLLIDPASVRGDWNDGDTVTIVLREAINDGGCDMFYNDSVQFIIDLTPPYVASVSPACLSTIYSSTLNFNYTLGDSISGVNPSTDIVTVTVRNAEDGIWHTDSTIHTGMYELTGLSDGDTVEFCVVGASDSPDLFYCPANIMEDYCCEYYISMAEPYAWIINPVDLNFDGWTISSCPCQEIEMGIYDRNGIDTDTIVFFVEDDTMSISDPRLTYTEIDDTVFITYTPYDPSPCWDSCEHVHFGLLFATDVLHSGFLDTPVIDSFYVDLEPPAYTDFIPAEGETLSTTMINISALSTEACTYEICDSAYFDIIVNDTDSTRAMGGLSTSQGPFEDGDEIRVCVSGCHDNPDYCDPNMTRTCNTFYISLGEPYGWIIQPLDENGDGNIISHCNCQSIIVGVFDSHGIDTMSIELEVEGIVYSLDDPQLSLYFDGDTVQIEFTPSSPCWSHNQIVNYELITANNSLGQPLVEPVIGSFQIDLEGPVYSGFTPLPSSVLSTTTLEISAEFYDSICGEEGSVFDSMQIWVNDSLISHYDTIFYELTGLENNDSVHVCVYAHDNCQDYCTANNSDTCWNFRISLGTIAASLLEPIDITGDGRVISNCECQPIIWRITHTEEIDESSIEIEVDGESIAIEDPRLVYYSTSDSLVFTPSPCWDETDSINFALVNIEDVTGSSLGSAMTGYVIIDLDPPYIYDMNPLSGIIYTDSVTVQIWYTDSICSTVVLDSMVIHINSDSVIISYVDSHFIGGLSDGDSITVFSWLHDECSDYCASNDSMYYWHFTVELGEPYAWIVEPIDINGDFQVISNCECQPIILRVYDEYGIDETTVEMVVLGTTYDFDSPEITVSTVGDSTEIQFTPSPCWTDGQYVEYTLTEASNTLGEPLTSEISGNFTVDLAPPEYSGEYPGDGSSISIPDVTIEIDIEDAICIDAVLDSITVTFDGTHLESFIGSETPELTGLSEGSYEVCCYSHDDCFDYCSPNYGDYCWNFNVSFTCSLEVDAGPDQISCPGVEFEIGCDPTAWNGTEPYTYEWTSSYPSDDPADIENPTVSPYYPTTYYLTVTDSLGCTASDSIVIDIPYEPLGTFDLIYPSFDTVAVGEVEFCWSMPSGTDPYFDFILDDETLVRALTDTCYRVEFPCGEYHTWAVVAYNYCHYDMDFWPCRSDSIAGTISDSSVVGGDPPFWTEPCGAPVVHFEEPVDLNGDGDTISACECQRIVWSYSSTIELDFDELVVNVNGTEYSYSDDEIDIVADSIIFTPSLGECWEDDDIVYAYVSFLDDTAGVPIEDSAYGAFLVDLDPPVFSGPSPLGVIYEDSASITLIAESDVCAEANYDSMIVTSSISEMIWRFYDGFDQVITGLVDNDSVHICAYASETCHDYCTPLISSNCWDFLVDLPCDMTVEAMADSFICYGATAELEAIITGGTSPFTYLWYPDTLVEDPDAQSTETINLFETTEFTLFAFDTNGCTDSVHFMVNVGEEIDIDLIPAQTLCVGVEYSPLCSIIGTSGDYTSIWVSSESETLTIDDPTIAILDTIDRTWEIQVVDEYGCEGSANVDISVPNTIIGSVSLVSPTCLDTISSGLTTIEWSQVDNADYYTLLVNSTIVEDSIPYGTETHDYDFECGNEYEIEIIAYRSCYYELFDCDSAVAASGFTAPESSRVTCSIYTENCGAIDAYFTLPMPEIISACSDQNILMEIIDNMGYDIDPSSIDFSVNGTHYSIDDTELTFTDDILSFSPDIDFFTDGEVVAILHDAVNEMGIPLDDSVVLEFSIDITPPEALFVDPGNDESIYETSPVLEFELDDNLSGINPNSADLTVNGITYSGLVLDWFDDVMSFDCNTNGVEFAEGDSIPIVLEICDSPTPPESLYCSPNCASFEWFFRIIQDFDCDAVPIPFTPLEMSNNYVQFEYPGLSTEEASIKIFNARNVLIREIDVSPGSGARNYARWDGNDNSGNMQRPGLYLYVVVVNDEIICNGTIVLAR